MKYLKKEDRERMANEKRALRMKVQRQQRTIVAQEKQIMRLMKAIEEAGGQTVTRKRFDEIKTKYLKGPLPMAKELHKALTECVDVISDVEKTLVTKMFLQRETIDYLTAEIERISEQLFEKEEAEEEQKEGPDGRD